MILAALLTLIFTIMAIICFVSMRTVFSKRLLLSIYIAAVFIVLNPSYSTKLANLFGVGRGVDFVLIVLVVALGNAVILYIRHVNAMQRNITKLARHIAKQDALDSTPNA